MTRKQLIKTMRVLVSSLALSSCALNDNTPDPLAPIRQGHVFTQDHLATIAFISPGSQVTETAFHNLKKTFPLCAGPYVKSCEPYHADTDQGRFEELHGAIQGNRPYLWAVRGGYGSARLYDDLKNLKKPAQDKVFMGHSDVTFLHLFFAQWGWKTLHCAMPVDLTNATLDPQNFTLIKDILDKPQGEISYGGLIPLNDLARDDLSITGPVIGGNLTLLTNSLGTPWQIKGKDRILFIEEVGSKGYMDDRNFLHLMQAGVFKDAKAVILGTFTEGDDNTAYACQRFADGVGIPVFRAHIFGHGPRNYPLPFGFHSTLVPEGPDGLYTLTIPYDFSKSSMQIRG